MAKTNRKIPLKAIRGYNVDGVRYYRRPKTSSTRVIEMSAKEQLEDSGFVPGNRLKVRANPLSTGCDTSPLPCAQADQPVSGLREIGYGRLEFP